jgi:hypothetical protein
VYKRQPQHITIERITLDGHGDTYQPATRGRVLCTYASGLRLNDAAIVNAWRQGWWKEGPTGLAGGWPRIEDGFAAEDEHNAVYVYRCNLSREPDVPNDPGGGAVYLNGTSDARFYQFFVAYGQGGYNIKIGPKGPSRFVGGETWGGNTANPADNITATVTYSRSGTTGTITGLPITPTYKAMRVGEDFLLFGQLAVDASLVGYYGKVLTISGGGAGITFTVPNSGPTTANSQVVLARQLFPQWGVIQEGQDGFTGLGFKFAGAGYLGQALIRRNGFYHFSQQNYIPAGNGVRAGIIQPGFQIGDTANGFNNVSGVFIDAYMLDFLGPQVTFNSSGGFNRIELRGFANYSGFSLAPSGTPNATDEIDVRIDGSSATSFVRQRPAVIVADASTADALMVRGRASDGIGAIGLQNATGSQIFKVYNSGTAVQVEMNGANAFQINPAGSILPNADNAIALGGSGQRWRFWGSELHLPGIPSYADDAAAASGGLPVGRVYLNTTSNALRPRQT